MKTYLLIVILMIGVSILGGAYYILNVEKEEVLSEPEPIVIAPNSNVTITDVHFDLGLKNVDPLALFEFMGIEIIPKESTTTTHGIYLGASDGYTSISGCKIFGRCDRCGFVDENDTRKFEMIPTERAWDFIWTGESNPIYYGTKIFEMICEECLTEQDLLNRDKFDNADRSALYSDRNFTMQSMGDTET